MFGTMLPAIPALTAVNIIAVKVIVPVDVDVAAVPIAVAPPAADNAGPNNDPRPPGESRFDHAEYSHMAVVPEAVRQELAGDFS